VDGNGSGAIDGHILEFPWKAEERLAKVNRKLLFYSE
jgi:hypothetical protein